MKHYRAIWYAALTLACSMAGAEPVYQYQDDNGKTVFSDKKPSQGSAKTLELSLSEKRERQPDLHIDRHNGQARLHATNPFHFPIQVRVQPEQGPAINSVVPAQTNLIIHSDPESIPAYRYRWMMGDPQTRPTSTSYQVPVASPGEFEIIQGFHGSFSHSEQPSTYAIDIAMQVGTRIAAARAGTVVRVKDNYSLGGNDRYFADKANVIRILHSDGTFGNYYHLLEASAQVKEGDTVRAGDVIARSGSSGFSTGPHLHFSITRNKGMAIESVPFTLSAQGHSIEPRKGLKLEVPAPDS